MALQSECNSLRRPEGRRIRTELPILDSTTAELPPLRANLPPSPGRDSTLFTGVPSGI